MQHKPKNNIKKNASYFLTLTVVGWVDVFTRKNHRKAILEAFLYCIKNKGLNIYAYCIMSNHIHLIVNCHEPFKLKDTMRDLKRHIAKTIISQIINEPESRREWMLEYFEWQAGDTNRNTKFKFWQTGKSRY